MTWPNLSFGKHIGKSLPQIVLSDPDWFFWAVEENIFREVRMQREAKDVSDRALSRTALPHGFTQLSIETALNDFNDLASLEIDVSRKITA